MLDLAILKQNFPPNTHQDEQSILREYLQCHVLKSIFSSNQASKLVFIGGTALRIAYQTQRFSEDLDFDNKGLSIEDWTLIGDKIVYDLSKLGFKLEITKTRLNDTVFHHNIKFLELLFHYGIAGHINQKLMIKVDSENQGIEYNYDSFDLNRFDVRSKIKVMPIDIALSQKFRAFFDRAMGRDLFDISSLISRTKPNYNYLKQALGINEPAELKSRVLARCDELELADLEKRALPFLFNKDDLNRIKFFKDEMQQYEF